VFNPEQMLFRLYGMASPERFPERIYIHLTTLEDAWSLARDGAYETLPEVVEDIIAFLSKYAQHAPDDSSGMPEFA
jgi:hypothetical protein